MDDKEQQELVDAVSRQIAFLLADLEKRTGCYVEDLGVRDIDVTTMSSRSQDFLRSVEIELRRQPGARWQT